jgi:hypothetical protein
MQNGHAEFFEDCDPLADFRDAAGMLDFDAALSTVCEHILLIMKNLSSDELREEVMCGLAEKLPRLLHVANKAHRVALDA